MNKETKARIEEIATMTGLSVDVVTEKYETLKGILSLTRVVLSPSEFSGIPPGPQPKYESAGNHWRGGSKKKGGKVGYERR